MAVPINYPEYQPIETVRAASHEERERMLAEWDAEFVRINPAYYHSDGTLRSLLNTLFGSRK